MTIPQTSPLRRLKIHVLLVDRRQRGLLGGRGKPGKEELASN